MNQLPASINSIEDLLANEAFRRWVLHKSPADRALWHEWLRQYPECRDLYEEAVAVFLTFEGTTKPVPDAEVRERAAQIVSRLDHAQPVIRPLWGKLRWLIAASLLLVAAWWQLMPETGNLSVVYNHLTDNKAPDNSKNWKEVRNMANKPMVVILPEKSSVLLYPNSRIRFRKSTSAELREVYLEGEGFFEVTKNPEKPFVVYTSTLTTRVLGTSFQIRSFTKEKTAFVKVKTGKVTVTSVADPEKKTLLTVNEQLTLAPESVQIVKHENPPKHPGEPADILTNQFNYEFTPVTQIFDQLETLYNIPIQYDRNLLKNCTFTGQLNDTPFAGKIRLICLTIESSYEIVNNQVIIHSQGCN